MILHRSRTRRQMLQMAASGGTALAGGALIWNASLSSASAQDVVMPVADLMAPEALDDVWMGSADAPVTMIEYASMTCPHCAAFQAETFPTLKSKYIDTGKVRYTLREFPFDPLATAGFMLARCVDPDKRNAMIDLLFAQQKNWAYSDKPFQGLSDLVKQTGMTQDKFEACLKDQGLYDKVNSVRDRAAEKFGVNATPTFFVNGKKAEGEMTLDQLDGLITPFLPKG